MVMVAMVMIALAWASGGGWHSAWNPDPTYQAYLDWGDPEYTQNDSYIGPGPDWFLGAEKTGGDWTMDGWLSLNATNSPALLIHLDRSVLTNNLAFVQLATGDTTGDLRADLLDEYGDPLALDLLGNLLDLEDPVHIPLAQEPDAATLRLRHAAGEVLVQATRLYMDDDLDGLSAEQEAQLGTSDQDSDTDGDGYTDLYETQTGYDPLNAQNHPASELTLIVPPDITIEYGQATDPTATGQAEAYQNNGETVALTHSDQVLDAASELPPRAAFQFSWCYNMALAPNNQNLDGLGGDDWYDTAAPPVSGGVANGGAGLLFRGDYTGSLWRLGLANGNYTVEFSVNVQTNGTEGAMGSLGFFGEKPSDANQGLRLNIKRQGQTISNGSTVTQALGTNDNTFGFHAFRIARVAPGRYEIWRDGKRLTTAPVTGTNNGNDDGCFLGAFSTSLSGGWQMDDLGLTSGAYAPDMPVGRLIRRTWTAVGTSSTTSAVQRILVQDTTPPVLSAPIDHCYAPGGPSDPSQTGEATVVDQADPNPTMAHTDRDIPLRASLRVAYALDERPFSNRLHDDSSHRRAGDPISVGLGEAGRIGRAAAFDGVSDYVDLGNAASISGVGDFTVSVWVKSDANGFAISQRDSAADGYAGGYYLGIVNGKAWFRIYSWYYAETRTVESPVAVNDGQWHHLVGVRRSNQSLRLYVDGVRVAEGASFGYGLNGNTRTYLGCNRRDNSNYFRGLLDDVTIWDRALDDGEIALINERGLDGKNAASLERLIERDWTATDASGNTVTVRQRLSYAHDAAPALTAPASVNLGPADWTVPARQGSAQATDDHDPTPLISWTDRHDALSQGLLVRFGLDEPAGSATVASDALTGTLQNGVGLGEPGVAGTSARFDGTNDRIALGSSATLDNLRSGLTVAAWIRPETLTGIRRIFSSGHQGGWGFGLNGTKLRFTTYYVKDYDLTAPLKAGKWQHIAAVMDAGYGVTFYLNGERLGYIAGAAPATVGTSGWYLGSAGSMEYWNGRLDEVLVWNRALSDGDIALLAARGREGAALRTAPAGDTLSIERAWTARNYAGLTATGIQTLAVGTASADADGDGIDARAEYLLGTDPATADSDRDGIADGVEVTLGLDTLSDRDGLSDADGDGLTLAQELAFGTDPEKPDSLGDGRGDALVHLGLTGDLAQYTETVLQTLPGVAATNVVGEYFSQGDALEFRGYRGSADYRITIPADGVYQLEVEGGDYAFYSNDASIFPLNLLLDGVSLGRRTLRTVNFETGIVRWTLPYLAAGEYDLRLKWENLLLTRRLRIAAVRLVAIEGPDTDEDGVADWVSRWMEARNGLDETSAASAVSPVFLQGRAAYPRLGRLGETPLNPAPHGQWYANLNLAEEGTTTALLAFENGALAESVAIAWTAHDPMQGGAFLLRTGDTLKVAGDGVALSGVTNLVLQAGAPAYLRFDQPGRYTLFAQVGGQSAQTIVDVLCGQFPDDPAVWPSRPRDWTCPAIAPELTIESDSHLNVYDRIYSGPGRQFHLALDKNEDAILAARTEPGGPILDTATITATPVYSTAETYLRVIETWEDGTRIVEMPVVARLEDGMSIRLEIFVGGISFEDGTTVKNLTTADFDANGVCMVRFIYPANQPTSVCHRLSLWDDGVKIADR